MQKKLANIFERIELIKLLATDVDGTLYNSNNKISKKNRKAIKKCMDKGIKVVLSTGRGIYSARRIIKDLGLKNPHVLSNGTLIIDKNLNNLEYLTLKRASYEKIVKLSRDIGEQLIACTIDGHLLFESDYNGIGSDLEEKENGLKLADMLLDAPVDKILICTIITEDNTNTDFKKFGLGDDIKIRKAGPYFTNFLDKRAGKTNALKKVIKSLGIKQDEFMAIGDGENDKGMIKLAKIGVAMGNASKEIKNAADYVAGDNDNDGLAEAIYKFIKV